MKILLNYEIQTKFKKNKCMMKSFNIWPRTRI